MTPTARLAYAGLWLLGCLPLPLLHAVASLLAPLLAPLSFRESRVARINVALCFPELDPAARRRLHRQVLRETLCVLLESGRVWTRPRDHALRWVREVQGIEHLQSMWARGQGVLVAAPHLGNWELFGQFLASLGPLSIVYREPQWAPAMAILLRGRGGEGVEQLPAQPGSVRGMLRALKSNRLLGLLPDQQPKVGEGEFAPFFGQPALTMTLLSRLAARAEAPVVFGFAERLPRGGGFRIRFLPAPENIAAVDPLAAVAALNAGIEACVREQPAQYQWTYKRFSRPPAGARNPYLRGHAAARPTSGSP